MNFNNTNNINSINHPLHPLNPTNPNSIWHSQDTKAEVKVEHELPTSTTGKVVCGGGLLIALAVFITLLVRIEVKGELF